MKIIIVEKNSIYPKSELRRTIEPKKINKTTITIKKKKKNIRTYPEIPRERSKIKISIYFLSFS